MDWPFDLLLDTPALRWAARQVSFRRRGGGSTVYSALSAFAPRQERYDQLHRQREQDRGTLLPGDLGQRLQAAQLDRTRVAAEKLGRLHPLLGPLLLACRMDPLSSAPAPRLALPGAGADHGHVAVQGPAH